MKNKPLMGVVLLLGVIVVLMLALLFSGYGRGVSQEDYNAVVAQRGAAQAQVTSLQSDLGKGSTFTVRLPLEREGVEAASGTG